MSEEKVGQSARGWDDFFVLLNQLALLFIGLLSQGESVMRGDGE